MAEDERQKAMKKNSGTNKHGSKKGNSGDNKQDSDFKEGGK